MTLSGWPSHPSLSIQVSCPGKGPSPRQTGMVLKLTAPPHRRKPHPQVLGKPGPLVTQLWLHWNPPGSSHNYSRWRRSPSRCQNAQQMRRHQQYVTALRVRDRTRLKSASKDQTAEEEGSESQEKRGPHPEMWEEQLGSIRIRTRK